jgi:vitamin B12 transporter
MFCYYNVGSASVTGNSLSAEQMLGQTRVYGSYDWLNARNDVSGKQLNLRSPEQALLGLDASVESWKLGVSVRGVSDRYEDASNTKVLKGYVLLNFKISKTLDRDWQALARLDNASNALYQTVDATTLAPGRSVFIGLQWQPS